MLVKTYCSAVNGIQAVPVTVEVHITAGIGMFLVGLPDNAIRESQERIRAAFACSGFKMSGKNIVVNLAPADLRKEGSGYDLAIGLGILAASGQVSDQKLSDYILLGELSLDGSLLPVKGALSIAVEARNRGFKGLILPAGNAEEAAVVEGLDIHGMNNLKEVTELLNNQEQFTPLQLDLNSAFTTKTGLYEYDFKDVKGQLHVKRALEIAAAGGHNLLMIGPPGSGKTMLARRLPSIIPPLTLQEALETTKIHSVAGKLGTNEGLMTTRPFRAPHHLMSRNALVGGGSNPQPGEVSLAHNGILFLDELPEFGRQLLESLRQPLEDKRILVSRTRYTVEYPADFMLVASMNPCPCGYYNHPTRECTCSQRNVYNYMGKISGPLLDRIDLHIEVAPVPFQELSEATPAENSATIRERVVRARDMQVKRLKNTPFHMNASMESRQIREFCQIDEPSKQLLERAMDQLNLSARAYDRILKVARTIADLAGVEKIETAHIAEAIQYRSLDRNNWGRIM